MQGPNWNDLRAFLAIAQAGQIGRAAATLKVDPTTLGRRLRRLELTIGANLFERSREGQSLTEQGESLLAKVEAMDGAARAIDEAASSTHGIAGTLRISVSEGFGSRFLTRYLGEFAAAHPQLTVELVASSGFLSPSRREADIAVMLSRPKAGPVVCRSLSKYRLSLYASKDYLLRRGAPKELADLAKGHTLISYIPDLLYAPELNYLAEFHPDLTARLRSSSINAQFRLIEAGSGIGVLPCFIGSLSAELAAVCPGHAIERNFWLVTHRDTENLARIKAGRTWLQNCVTRGRSILLGD